jgi:hypothetical protein
MASCGAPSNSKYLSSHTGIVSSSVAQVLRTPHARPSVRALLRDEQWDVWCERERGAAFYGRRRAEHATDEDNLSGCVRFAGVSCSA